MDTTYAAAWVALFIFLASVISVEIALSAAIIEIVAGGHRRELPGTPSCPLDGLPGGLRGHLADLPGRSGS